MSLGPLVIDIEGYELTSLEAEIISHPLVGGIILFSSNYKNKTQITTLISNIRKIRNPILITVDQEGGRVQRFKEGFTKIPSMGKIGDLFDKDQNLAVELAKDTGWLVAAELLSCGVDLSYAPVVDLNNPISKVIGDRAFHKKPDVVARLADSFIKGMNSVGMSACIKHFPGHGSVAPDSHFTTPYCDRDLNDIYDSDIQAFIPLLTNKTTAAMTAHIMYSKIDSTLVSFSKIWIQQILRNELKFKGAVISDDLSMKGACKLEESAVLRAEKALQAGSDLILLCNARKDVLTILDNLKYESLDISIERRLNLLNRCKDYDLLKLGKNIDKKIAICKLYAELF